jgi:hypothetical protein
MMQVKIFLSPFSIQGEKEVNEFLKICGNSAISIQTNESSIMVVYEEDTIPNTSPNPNEND